jgi:hypothetical protein
LFEQSSDTGTETEVDVRTVMGNEVRISSMFE